MRRVLTNCLEFLQATTRCLRGSLSSAISGATPISCERSKCRGGRSAFPTAARNNCRSQFFPGEVTHMNLLALAVVVSLQGTVIKTGSNEPVVKAVVELRRVDGGSASRVYTATTTS